MVLKKFIVGALLLGFSGVLVVGAINRTTDRLERESRSGESRQGRQTETVGGLGQRYGENRPETSPEQSDSEPPGDGMPGNQQRLGGQQESGKGSGRK